MTNSQLYCPKFDEDESYDPKNQRYAQVISDKEIEKLTVQYTESLVTEPFI